MILCQCGIRYLYVILVELITSLKMFPNLTCWNKNFKVKLKVHGIIRRHNLVMLIWFKRVDSVTIFLGLKWDQYRNMIVVGLKYLSTCWSVIHTYFFVRLVFGLWGFGLCDINAAKTGIVRNMTNFTNRAHLSRYGWFEVISQLDLHLRNLS